MSTIRQDIAAAIKSIENAPPANRRPATAHHPKCQALATNRVLDCNCGGYLYPIS